MLSRAVPPLHLYRHLLREATYLPKHCAPYVRQQITTRFHKHKNDDPTSLITKGRLHGANTHLRSLRAANAGVLTDMKRILHLAIGHLGRRRRKLIAQTFLVAEPKDKPPGALPPGVPTSLRLQTHHRGQPLDSDWLDNWDLPKLSALAASQARQSFPNVRPEIKPHKLEPTQNDVPAENSLGRPLGAKAARRHLRNWYKGLINRVMAPLPRQEWEALGRVARGEEGPWEGGPPARRTWCGHGEVDSTTATATKKKKKKWDWKVYAVEPVRSIERGQSRSLKARTGEEGEGPYGTGKAIGLHRYERTRLWQRLYSRLWEATPTMKTLESGRDWKIEWGQKEARVVPVATSAQMAFFEGASDAGKKGGKARGRSSKSKKAGLVEDATA